jgi:hypothetical protein
MNSYAALYTLHFSVVYCRDLKSNQSTRLAKSANLCGISLPLQSQLTCVHQTHDGMGQCKTEKVGFPHSSFNLRWFTDKFVSGFQMYLETVTSENLNSCKCIKTRANFINDC